MSFCVYVSLFFRAAQNNHFAEQISWKQLKNFMSNWFIADKMIDVDLMAMRPEIPLRKQFSVTMRFSLPRWKRVGGILILPYVHVSLKCLSSRLHPHLKSLIASSLQHQVPWENIMSKCYENLSNGFSIIDAFLLSCKSNFPFAWKH